MPGFSPSKTILPAGLDRLLDGIISTHSTEGGPVVWSLVLLEQYDVCCPNPLSHSAGLPAFIARVYCFSFESLLDFLGPAPF